MSGQRKIIHCDCDSFYASIEMRDNPSLRDKPIAVGGLPTRRGVVATCNYQARKFGVHSAMASATARRLCPDLIIVRPDMEKYRQVSGQIHDIFKRYTDLIEPLSLDEAYLDVSDCEQQDGSATLIAEAIRDAVRDSLHITISAGVAPNKFLAKVASDWNKPDGLFVIRPEDVERFIYSLEVRKLHGVGKVTSEKMQRLGVTTCGDLQQFSRDELQQSFGSFGERLYHLCRGIDTRQVSVERIRKSVSVENTYASDLPDLPACQAQIPELMAQLERRLSRVQDDYCVWKQFIKIKFCDFTTTTVEMLSEQADQESYNELCAQGFSRGDKPVRLLGIGVRVMPASDTPESSLEPQLSLLKEPTEP